MGTVNIRRTFVVVGVAALLLSYLGIWLRMISNPTERTGSDFMIFYTAGRIAQTYGMQHIYDLALQHDIEEEQVGFSLAQQQVLPFNHLPFLIPILSIFIGKDYVSSFYRWDLTMLVIYVIGIALLGSLLKERGIAQKDIQTLAIGALLFLPLFVSLMNGQDTALLLLGASMWAYGLFSNRPVLSGIGLSLTTVRPHIALVLALPMLFSHRKVFLGFLLGTGILTITSFLILGIGGTREFIGMLLLTAGGEWYGVKPNEMFNLIGLLTRVFPRMEGNTIRLVGWLLYGITVIWLCIYWRGKKDLQNGIIGSTVILALFVAPHLYFHDLTLLLIPVYELLWRSRKSEDLKTSIAIGIPIAISLLLLFSNISPYLQYTVPYLIMLALVLYPNYLKPKIPFASLHRS